MDNWKFVLFLIFSIVLHGCLFFFFKYEVPELKTDPEMTMIDLIDRKKEKKKPIPSDKSLPKHQSAKGVELNKKKEKIIKEQKKPAVTKAESKPVKSVGPTVGKKENLVPTQKQQKKAIPKELTQKIFKKDKSLKANDQQSKQSSTPQKQVFKDKSRVPIIAKKRRLNSLSDLNIDGVIDDLVNQPSISSGDDYIDLHTAESHFASYFSKFKRKIERNWNYPQEAAYRGEEGTVIVRFSILKDGTITDVKLLTSSGYPDLDREVLRVLKTVRPYPLPGNEPYKNGRLNIEANFQYMLYDRSYRIY